MQAEIVRQVWHSRPLVLTWFGAAMGSSAAPKVMWAACWGPSGEIILTLKKETQGFLTPSFSRLCYGWSLMSGVCCLRGMDLNVGWMTLSRSQTLLSLCSFFFQVLKTASWLQHLSHSVPAQQQPEQESDCPFLWLFRSKRNFPIGCPAPHISAPIS